MPASVNKVILVGNLGQDPELRYTANQTPVVTMNIATTDYRASQDGQRQEFTEWHRVVVWNKLAENCSKYLAKGRTVFVEGRLQTRSWEDKTTGQKRYATEIVAQNVQFLGGPGATRGENAGRSTAADAGNPYQPVGAVPDFELASQSTPANALNNDQMMDDIPF